MSLQTRLDGPLGLVLAPLGWLYAAVARLRVVAYRRSWIASTRPPLPTMSIGNLAAGGTGKTPLLLEALRWLQQQQATIGVLSRGYGGDEGQILRARFPQVALVEDSDRRRGLRTLLAAGRPEVLLLDDGFQHLKLQRDVDVVLLDATRPLGRCFPAGLFREGPGALRRADLVVLSRADLVAPEQRERIWRRVKRLRGGAPTPLVEGGVRAQAILPLGEEEASPLASWRGREVGIAAGIGNFASFRSLVEALGMTVKAEHQLRDHHPWSRQLVEQLQQGAVGGWRGPWLVTEKDAVKIEQPAAGLHELRVDWFFLQGSAAFQEHLAALHLPARAARIEPLWAAHDPEGKGVR